MSLVLLVVFLGIAYIALAIDNRVLKSILLLAVFISLVIVGWNVFNVWRLRGEVSNVVTHLKELDRIELTEIYLLDQESNELEAETNEHWELAVRLQTTADEQSLLNTLKQDHDAYMQTFATIVTTYQQGDRAEAVRLSVEEARISLDDVQQRVDEFVNQMELQLCYTWLINIRNIVRRVEQCKR